MKSITYTFLLFITLLIGALAAKAQTVAGTAKITGLLVTEQGKPADYATVSLLRAQDSSVVKSSLSNEAGQYTLDRLAAGTYIVKATIVGYDKSFSKPVSVTAGLTASVPVIKLTPATNSLKAVNITAAKPLIERKIDRTVINVENSVLAAGNSAMEILERAPGVTLDKDDNISLRGKQGVTVMIDGKLTYLSSAQLSALLRSTDGNTIQSIEIITNPSAKYDAAGNSGIINIKLKKNRNAGTNGSFTASAGYGRNHKASSALNINHKNGKLNLFGNYSYSNSKRPQDINLNRTINNNGISTFYDESTDFISSRQSHNYKLGADYDISKTNTIGIQVTGFNSASDANAFNNTLISADQIIPRAVTTTNNNAAESYNNMTANLNNRIVLDTLGKELSMDADYSFFNNRQSSNYSNNFYRADGSTLITRSLLRNSLPTQINIGTFKADFTNPIGKTMKLEAGMKFSYVNTNNNLRADSVANPLTTDPLSRTWVADGGRSNLFIYTENINAGYLNFNKTWKKTSVQLGLRAEQTNSTGDSRGLNNIATVNNRHYLDLFPSIFINRELSDNHTLGVNYSRRIDRPSYDDLNSFTQILNAYTFVQGNPNLKPQYTNSFDLNYTFKKTYNVTLNYSKTTDVMAELPRQIDEKQITFITRDNLAEQNSYSLNISAPVTVKKWWTTNNNINSFYLGFKSNSPELTLNDGQFVVQINSINTFTLSKTVKLEGTFNYQSGLTYGLFHISENYGLDAGISKSFAQKKASLKFAVSDVFNTRQQKLNVRQGNLNFNVFQKNETRIARLSLTYNFGSTKIQARRRESGGDAERSRVKGS